jgi:Holliday junction resolvase RusA-like endonuclease
VTKLSFDVLGIPVTQGSGAAITNKHTGKAVFVQDHRPKLHAWRADIAHAAANQAAGAFAPRTVPVVMHAIFRVPRPVSEPKRVTAPCKKPDGDKLARALFDGLCGVLYADDSQVVKFSIEKRFARADEAPGVSVWVEWPTQAVDK